MSSWFQMGLGLGVCMICDWWIGVLPGNQTGVRSSVLNVASR